MRQTAWHRTLNAMIEIQQLTKRYGSRTVVDDLTVTVRPGSVTAFLGPNGAGKTTTMRMALGLATATSGAVLLGGRRYVQIARPLVAVGALLDATRVEAGRSAIDHLRWLALSNRIEEARVCQLLELVGLGADAGTRIGTFSLGMMQRLGIAAALVGDPGILILDEPTNGLDPDGVRWLRELLRGFASEGRTVFVSSHLMSEVAITAERVVIIAGGRLLADASVTDLAERLGAGVIVRSPAAVELASALEGAGATLATGRDGQILVTGLDAEAIGHIAAARRLPLLELSTRRATVEEAYLAITGTSRASQDPAGQEGAT